MAEKKCFTFDQLYKQYKKNGRGLNPYPKKRGRENPCIIDRAQNIMQGLTSHKGFALIELAMKYPTSLNGAFQNIKSVDISHWVKRYA